MLSLTEALGPEKPTHTGIFFPFYYKTGIDFRSYYIMIDSLASLKEISSLAKNTKSVNADSKVSSVPS